MTSVDYYIGESITDITENRLFDIAIKNTPHGGLAKIGTRYFRIYNGPEHDSWEEIWKK